MAAPARDAGEVAALMIGVDLARTIESERRELDSAATRALAARRCACARPVNGGEGECIRCGRMLDETCAPAG